MSDAARTGSVPANNADLSRLRGRWMPIAGVGLIVAIVCYFVAGREQFLRSYLHAYMFCLGLPLGSLGLLLLQHLTGGQWAFVSRRFLEAGTRLLPVMALLFIPIWLGMSDLYVWAAPGYHPEHHSENAVPGTDPLAFKMAWLNATWFAIRAVIYFGIWIGMMLILNTWSAAQDRARNSGEAKQSLGTSAPMLVIFVLSVTAAVVDWVMSIDPMWFSTIFGMHFVVGQALTTLCIVVLLLAALHDRAPLAGVVTREHFHDLGKLMFAFTMLWGYINLSQFLIIWMGNIKEETPFYIVRSHGLPGKLSPVLIMLHFFVPFLLLLSRHTKRSISTISKIAIFILIMRIVDMIWIVKPSFDQAIHNLYDPHSFHWLDIVMPLAVAGVCAFVYLVLLGGRPLLAPNDARLAEAEAAAGGHH